MGYDFLSDAEKASLSGNFDTVFQTLSNGRTVTVVKEPLKTLVSTPSSNNLFGFGERQTDPTFIYTPVSGIFPAMIIYASKHPSPLNPEINVRVYAGPVTIKVQQDCRDYINDGVNKHILADGKTFFLDGEERRQLFLNGTYYFYNLKATK